jgi:hypothetical protein
LPIYQLKIGKKVTMAALPAAFTVLASGNQTSTTSSATAADPNGYRRKFIELVNATTSLQRTNIKEAAYRLHKRLLLLKSFIFRHGQKETCCINGSRY